MTQYIEEKVFDCFNEDCEECSVCKYLNFREWAESVAPSGSIIERNSLIEDYLKRKEIALTQTHNNALQEAMECLPEERIIHSYMPSQNTPENNTWNDYRNQAIKAIEAKKIIK